MPKPTPRPPTHDLLITAIQGSVPLSDGGETRLRAIPPTQPNRLRDALAAVVPGTDVVVTGTLERRLLCLAPAGTSTWLLVDLAGEPHATRDWPTWARSHLRLHQPGEWVSTAELTEHAITRLTRPRILLAALYHPEYFPLPRFPLGISDLARAARSTLSGHVELMDMQLGITLDDLVAAVRTQRPDVLGVSATFGQHDLMTRLLDTVTEEVPLVLAGGSLTARNEALLLERYPTLLVARGAGEATIADVIAHWHGDLTLDEVRGVGYTGAPRGTGTFTIGRRRTATVANRAAADILPELDLLEATFARRGVAQIESSRGCTNYCSFCPRGHKGTWAGVGPEQLPQILTAMAEEYDRHPEISRTLYLVDEEFIGRGEDAVPRALSIADTLADAGFSWETSCRIDQVVRPDRDRVWHLERAALWRGLVSRRLRRCLFGVESGVTSILTRFNKETTAEQNALAIRSLSALGVPTRFTYITFDHLMTVEELRATHAFQARTDLLLRPLPDLSVQEIVDGVRDPGFVSRHTAGRPFYTGISYMLVSMECLIGAAYTRAVQAAGLAGAVRPSMGRIDADFADWRIGACSAHAQLWVDRNFALDYTLKSLEKILDGQPGDKARAVRVVIRQAAFTVLTRMLDLIDTFPAQPDELNRQTLTASLALTLNLQFNELRSHMPVELESVVSVLPAESAEILTREYNRWDTTTEWGLINAADPCGT